MKALSAAITSDLKSSHGSEARQRLRPSHEVAVAFAVETPRVVETLLQFYAVQKAH